MSSVDSGSDSQLEKGLKEEPVFPVLTLNQSSTLNVKVVATTPASPKSQISPWVRFQVWFTLYQRLFAFIVSFNLVGLILCATRTWDYPRDYTGAFILGNLLLAVLARNELFTRSLYWFVNKFLAKWPPLWVRLSITSFLQHLGGVHSGCAVSGFMWLIFKAVIIFIDAAQYHPAILAFGLLTNVAIGISVISALPWIRDAHHNGFERHHRVVGWIGLIFTWVFTVLIDCYNLNTHKFDRQGRVFRQQDFWFCLGLTILIIVPWLTVRRVPVEITIPSPKVAIVKFKRGMQQGLIARVGRGGVLEYHAFGVVSEGKDADCHYLIAGVQGDFTRSLVENPPTHLWTRELKFAAVSNTSSLYRRGVRVCTGTGLGSGLATCIQNPDWYLIWMGSDTEKTFGPEVNDLIRKHLLPHRATIWDTKKRGGRPDVMKLILGVCEVWKPECVIITSNLSGSKEMMEGCKQAGYPAFGTLFDF